MFWKLEEVIVEVYKILHDKEMGCGWTAWSLSEQALQGLRQSQMKNPRKDTNINAAGKYLCLVGEETE